MVVFLQELVGRRGREHKVGPGQGLEFCLATS